MSEWVKAHPIKIYVAMCLLPVHAILWSMTWLGVEQSAMQPLKLLFSLLPTGSAFLLTYIGWGEEAVQNLWKRTFLKEGRLKAYSIALFVFIILGFLALALRYTIDDYFPFLYEFSPISRVLLMTPLLLLFPGFTEEYGWRGFMQHRLQEKTPVFVASLFVGLVWGTWHTMDFYMGNWPFSWLNVAAMYAYITGVSIVIGGLYTHFRASIFVAMLAHYSANAISGFTPVFSLDQGYLTPIIFIGLIWTCALGVLFVKKK